MLRRCYAIITAALLLLIPGLAAAQTNTTYTSCELLTKPGVLNPALSNAWGPLLNTNFDLIDTALTQNLTLNLPAQAGYPNVALAAMAGVSDNTRYAHYTFTGTLTANTTVLWPANLCKSFTVTNGTSGNFTLTLASNNGSGTAAGTTVAVPAGYTAQVWTNGVNVSTSSTSFGKATFSDNVFVPTASINVGQATPQSNNSFFAKQTASDISQSPFAVVRSDFASSFSGGTLGNIQANGAFPCTVSGKPNVGTWCVSSSIHSTAGGNGGHVAVAGSSFRDGLPGDGSVGGILWGLFSQVADTFAGTSTVNGPLVGAEIDVFANGADDWGDGHRAIMDLVYGKWDQGGVAGDVGHGIRIGPFQADNNQGKIGKAYELKGYYTVAGLDFTAALSSGSNVLGAIALGTSQRISFNGTSASKRYVQYNGAGNYLEYSNGSDFLFKSDDSGNFFAKSTMNAPTFSNSGSAPVFSNGVNVNGILGLNSSATRYFAWNGTYTELSNGSTSLFRVYDTGNGYFAGSTVQIVTPSTPASSSASCSQGEIRWDPNYVYVCVSNNTWKRTALASW